MISNSGVFKPFSKALYSEFDKAKGSVLDFLGESWSINPDQYGPDLTDGVKWVEVEIKTHWKTPPKFPYPTVQLPERKGKWKHLNIEYWILNPEATHAVVIPASALLEEFLIEVPNKYVVSGEKFYQIPIELCKILNLKTGGPEADQRTLAKE